VGSAESITRPGAARSLEGVASPRALAILLVEGETRVFPDSLSWPRRRPFGLRAALAHGAPGLGLGALLVLTGCASPPEERCTTRPGETALEIECGDSTASDWSDRALDEAQEGFERRAPGGRP
jgi:hypothetical protein